jgi:cytidylate kinase
LGGDCGLGVGEDIHRQAAQEVIIAVDGPTASGKGTVARALAAHFSLPHLDTGLLYRSVGRQVTLAGGDPDNQADALAACTFPDALLEDCDLRSEGSGGLASRVSIHPAVRQALYERQRAFATQPGGAVLDGRDIGTVIAPDADVKLFITANVEARAARRFVEMRDAGRTVSLAEIEADLAERDRRDSSRAAAPSVAAKDAISLDTSALNRDEAIAEAIRLVEKHA